MSDGTQNVKMLLLETKVLEIMCFFINLPIVPTYMYIDLLTGLCMLQCNRDKGCHD